jgi:4-hydroxy-3-polyprenylbenzoate decarboxylase
MGAALNIKRRLQKYGVPLTDVYVPCEGAIHMVIVGVKEGGHEVAQRILEALVISVRRADISKIIVVDEDVDVFNMDEVIHAFSTKCHPARGILVAQYEGKAQTLTPAYSQEERIKMQGASVVFDATWPLEWSRYAEVPVKSSFGSTYPKEMQAMALSKWQRATRAMEERDK